MISNLFNEIDFHFSLSHNHGDKSGTNENKN